MNISIDKAALTEMIREAVKKRLQNLKEAKKEEVKEGMDSLRATDPLSDPKSFANVGLGKNPNRDPKTFAAQAMPLTKPKVKPSAAGTDSTMRMEAAPPPMSGGAAPMPSSAAPMPAKPAAVSAAPASSGTPPMEEVGVPTQPNLQVADELDLFLRNESDLWGPGASRKTQILKNLAKKMKAGQYLSSEAPKLWLWLVNDAAKKYVAQFGDGPDARVDTIFNKATRMHVAQELAKWFEEQVQSGEISLDDLLGSGV